MIDRIIESKAECDRSHTKGYTTTGVFFRVTFFMGISSHKGKGVMGMIKINGQSIDQDKIYLRKYLLENEYEITRIAVERNEEIVPKAAYDETVLKDGDIVEIVSFVGGG